MSIKAISLHVIYLFFAYLHSFTVTSTEGGFISPKKCFISTIKHFVVKEYFIATNRSIFPYLLQQ